MSDGLLRRVERICFKASLKEAERLAYCHPAHMPGIEAAIEKYNRIHTKAMRRRLKVG